MVNAGAGAVFSDPDFVSASAGMNAVSPRGEICRLAARPHKEYRLEAGKTYEYRFRLCPVEKNTPLQALADKTLPVVQ